MNQTMASGGGVAFFGGSFDPPHLGHLAVARAARAALGLDTVLFAPVGAQPLKPSGSTASFVDRVAMTQLAIESEKGFEISLLDAPQGSGAPNYTIEAIERLRSTLQPGCTIYCLMGADSFQSLRLWHRAAELPFVAPLIVASRPGLPLDDLKAMLPAGLRLELANQEQAERPPIERSRILLWCYSVSNPAGQQAPFYLLPNLDVEISASKIRDWIRGDLPRAGEHTQGEALVPDNVAKYIRARGLYR